MSDSQTSGGSAAPAPKKRTGLTVFLYVLLFLTIGASLYLMSIKDKAAKNPLIIDAVAAYENLIKDMGNMTQAQIEQQGEHLLAAELAASPETVKGRYVVVDGQVQGEESTMVNQNMQAANMFVEGMKGGYQGYVLDDAVVLVNIDSTSTTALKGGDYARGFGAVLVVDIKDVWELPFVGPDLKKEFGNIEGTSEKVVFVISKGVQQISEGDIAPATGGGMDADAPADPAAPAVEGEQPADPATPPADGATPPVDGATPPVEAPPAPPEEGAPPAPPAEGATPPAGGH